MRRRPLSLSTGTKVGAGFFVVLTVLSFWNWNPFDGFFAPASFLFCVICTIALQRALRHRQILLAVYVIQSGLAYSFGSVRASYEGARLFGLRSTGSSVQIALLMAAFFVAIVTVTSVVCRPPRSAVQSEARPDIQAWMAALLLLAGCFADALRSGSWSAYSGGETLPENTGGFRLELLYPVLLTAIVILLCQEIMVRWSAGTRSRTAAVVQWSLLAVALVLLFMLQGRRYMITSLIFAGLLVLQSWPSLKSALRAPSRRLLVVGVATLAAWGVLFGSSLWRQAALKYGGGDVSIQARAQLMLEELDRDPESTISQRMTYLALDAATIEHYDEASDGMALHRMALSSLLVTLPGALFPWKYDEHGEALVETCEVAFRSLTNEDLPCTPEAEALLAGGPLGLALVAGLWGLSFALLARLGRRRAFLWQLVVLVGFIPLSSIETSAFPMFYSLRHMAIVGGLVWGLAAILRLLTPRSRRMIG